MQNENKYITFHTDTSGIQITNKSDPFNLDNSIPEWLYKHNTRRHSERTGSQLKLVVYLLVWL